MRIVIPLAALLGLAACAMPGSPQPASLALSNLGANRVQVDIVVTGNADCNLRAGPGVVGVSDFLLPPNGTRQIAAPAGAGICWRSAIALGQPRAGRWSPWSRATLVPGRTTDATL